MKWLYLYSSEHVNSASDSCTICTLNRDEVLTHLNSVHVSLLSVFVVCMIFHFLFLLSHWTACLLFSINSVWIHKNNSWISVFITKTVIPEWIDSALFILNKLNFDLCKSSYNHGVILFYCFPHEMIHCDRKFCLFSKNTNHCG